MDGPSFTLFARIARTAASRRAALTSALVPAAVGLGVTAFRSPGAIEAKNKKKKKCKKCKPKGLGEACTSNKECCTDETNRLCAIPSILSTNTVCCGGVGATCTSTDDCCGDFTCENGACDS